MTTKREEIGEHQFIIVGPNHVLIRRRLRVDGGGFPILNVKLTMNALLHSSYCTRVYVHYIDEVSLVDVHIHVHVFRVWYPKIIIVHIHVASDTEYTCVSQDK